MKYVIVTPIAVFCCELLMTPKELRGWLEIGKATCGGVYAHTHQIHNLLLQLFQCTTGVWVVDSSDDILPNGETPREYAEHLISATALGF